jgi:hypothetical protein
MSLVGPQDVSRLAADFLQCDELRFLLGVGPGFGHCLEPDACTQIDVGQTSVHLTHRNEREGGQVDVVLPSRRGGLSKSG